MAETASRMAPLWGKLPQVVRNQALERLLVLLGLGGAPLGVGFAHPVGSPSARQRQ